MTGNKALLPRQNLLLVGRSTRSTWTWDGSNLLSLLRQTPFYCNPKAISGCG